MQSLNDDERKEALGEILADELKVITEYVKDVPLVKQELKALKDDVRALKSDIKVVKAAVTDMSRQQKGQARRISKIEAA